MIYGYEIKDLANYPGDMVLRTSSTKIAGYVKQDIEKMKSEVDEVDQAELLAFFKDDLSNELKLKNIVTMTIISDSLEKSVIVAEKVNKKTNDIIDNILEKVLEEFLKENELDELDGNEEEFEHYLMNLEGNVSLKLRITGRVHNNDKFSSEVILRSNGGYDEIIKALPYISGEDYMKKKIKNAISQ